jgi:hypothetical protein
VKQQILELGGGKQRVAISGVVGEGISVNVGAKVSKVVGIEGLQINGSTGNRRVSGSGGGEVECKIAASMVSGGAVIQKDSLRESKPELKRVSREEDARINEGGVDGGMKGEIGNVSTTSDRVRGNGIRLRKPRPTR